MESSPPSSPTTTTAASTTTHSPHLPLSSPATPSPTITHDTLQLIALFIVGIVSSLANLLVVLTILMTRKLRSTPSSVLVTSLAVADVAVTSLTVPLAACGLIHQKWIFSQVTCTVTSTLRGVFSAASALAVAAIAVDRYLAILHCLRYTVWPRWRYALLVLGSTWVTALLFGVLLSTEAASESYVPEVYVCDVVSARSAGYVWSRALVVFFLPLALLAFAYARVIHVARNHSRKIGIHPRNRKTSSDTSRRAESVTTNGAVAAGAMFSVRRLSILSIPQAVEGDRRQLHISGDVELITASSGAGRGDGGHSPRSRSCASMKLVFLVLVFTVCCGFYTLVSLFETVVHSGDDDGGDGGEFSTEGVSGAGTQRGNKTDADDVLTHGFHQHHQHHQPLLTTGFWLLLLNSVLNPFMYAISSQRFRYFASRLFSKHDPQHGRDCGGGGGGNLFDVSIYSAFLKNLQTPTSRRSSGDSCCAGESSQHFPLTAMGDSISRRDSGCSVGTASTCVDSRHGSPVLRPREPRQGSSQFLAVPFASGTEDSTSDDDDTVQLRRTHVKFRRSSSLTSASSLSSNCSVSFCECPSSDRPGRACRTRSDNNTGREVIQDDFLFSANNAARIRIVIDMV